VIGNVGGIFGVFAPLSALIVAPIAEFNFFFKLIQKLFLAKTKNKLFE
jgi:hypothetical protein